MARVGDCLRLMSMLVIYTDSLFRRILHPLILTNNVVILPGDWENRFGNTIKMFFKDLLKFFFAELYVFLNTYRIGINQNYLKKKIVCNLDRFNM